MTVVTLCTGNAARSVMAGFMLEHLAALRHLDLHVSTAGTHAIEGQPMSMRTRSAMLTIDSLRGLEVTRHRSHQVTAGDLARADLVVAMEADHVRYVRRRLAPAAPRTAMLTWLVGALPAGPPPLADRIGALGLSGVGLDDGHDVLDPAGHGDEVYEACAHQIWKLCRELVERL